MPENKKTFELGLVMAGAVSAGAYTAGVIDFLLNALDDWEQAKTNAPDKTPDHNICLRVMTGASAGGMTTAIATVEMLYRAMDPQASRAPDYESRLKKAWVKQIDISHFLQTHDLKDGSVKSLLDSTVLDHIAKSVIDEKVLPPWKPLPYVAEELKLFLTLSNLRGLPYDIKLEGETGLPHGMTDHSDYQYVKVHKDMKGTDWVKLRNAAIATGAFPVGLASRLIERDMSEYEERLHKDGRAVSGLLKSKFSPTDSYSFVAVDGGLLNNEPIELARSVWSKVQAGDKNRLNSFNNAEDLKEEKELAQPECPHALVIIDPFPDQVDIGKDATPADTGLTSILGPIVGALRSQSLFKIEELLEAADQTDNDRFLIAPIRKNETDHTAKNAIACGFFGGFGGFLSEDFRNHDYHLGKRNCQRFLQKYFVLPLEKAQQLGWRIENEYVIEEKVKKKTGDQTEIETRYFYPIIPLIKESRSSEEQPKVAWPHYTKEKRDQLKKGMTTRAGALLENALPFGWIGKGWVVPVVILFILLALAGEFVKATQSQCDCMILINGLKNSYILILQFLFFLIAVALTVLRLAKRSIADSLVNKFHATAIKYLEEWTIRIK